MAKNDSKGQGSGVTFTPDASYAGPYNYTRADIPIYAPGTGYNQTLPTPPGTPPAAAPDKPGKTPKNPRPKGSGNGIVPGGSGGGRGGSGGGMAKGLGPPARNAFTGNGQNAAYLKNGGRAPRTVDNTMFHQTGSLPRMAVNQTGTGMALGGAGRGLNMIPRAMPRARAPQTPAAPAAPAAQWQDSGFDPNRPPPPLTGSMPRMQPPITGGSLPTEGRSDMMYRVPPGTTPPIAMPRQRAPIQTITAPSTPSTGGMPTSVPQGQPGVIGNANPGTGNRPGVNAPRAQIAPQQRSRYANALAGGAFRGR